jgi:hypothetical protein
MSCVFTVTTHTYPLGNVGARMHHHGTTADEPTPTTVRERLTAAGLPHERIEQHLDAGRVRVDGELVTDLDRPAPPPARVVLSAE